MIKENTGYGTMTVCIDNTIKAGIQQEKQLIEAVGDMCRRGDYLSAEKICTRYLESDTLGSAAHYLLGGVKICQNQMDQARVLLEAAIAMEPGNETYCKVLADVYLKLNFPSQAAGLYKHLLSISPNDESVIGWLNQNYSSRPLNQQIQALRLEAEQLIKDSRITAGKKVLYGPSFSIYPPCRMHDFLFTQALRLRGAEIVPLTLIHQNGDQLIFAQEGENGYFGGVWAGYTGNAQKDAVLYAQNNKKLLEDDNLLWKSWCGLAPISVAGYISREDRSQCLPIAQSINPADYAAFYYDSMPVGQWAADTLFNNETIVDPAQIDNFDSKLRLHVFNILLLMIAYNRVLDDICPDVIVTNDTFYYTWAVLDAVAQRKNIPCYNHWQGSRRNGWCYGKGQASMELDLSDPWKTFRAKPLQPHQASQIDACLAKRRKGAGLILNTACPQNAGSVSDQLAWALSQYSHKTLLCSNAVWDLAALNKQIVFEGMVDWIYAVIEHFARRPDKLLIIKAHPAETNPDIPRTRQSVGQEIARRFTHLPPNVIFIDSDAGFSVYQILEHIDLGLVYTTTTGLEMACAGKPVITSARSVYRGMGFTLDPETPAEYFQTLDYFLDGYRDNEQDIEIRIAQAKKFFYLYYFRYFTSLNLFEHGYLGSPILYVDTVRELLPGVNAVLDYVCDAVLNNKPMISTDRIAPEGGYERNIYHFDPAQVRRDARLVIEGYPYANQPQLLGVADGFERYQIAGHKLVVPEKCFKTSELQWLYNEINVGPDRNGHCYESGPVRINPGDVVIDAGACEGFFVDYALRKNASLILAFEPHPRIASGLHQTYQQAVTQGKVRVVQAALGNRTGKCNFDDGGEFICEAHLSNSGKNMVDLTTLDQFVEETQLARIDFVKADIEGQEMDMVAGMAQVLKRFKPRLSIAVYHGYENAQLVRQMILKIRPDYTVSFGGCYLFQSPARPFMLYAY